VRIFVLAGLLRIQLQLLDSLARSGRSARTFVTFAANTILASTDVVGLAPDPFERVVTADCPNGLGIDLPADGVAGDAISSDTGSVY
jgi:hypothetical protein